MNTNLIKLALYILLSGWLTCVSAEPVSLNIEAQPVATALTQFARQSGVQILFPVDDAIEHTRTARVSGTFQAEEALKILLSDSGLAFEFVNKRTVAIRVASSAAIPEVLVAGMRAPNADFIRTLSEVPLFAHLNVVLRRDYYVQKTAHLFVNSTLHGIAAKSQDRPAL